MELTSELLLQKGFKLNTYDEGKFWEFETKDEGAMDKILAKDYYNDEEILILQISEDFKTVIVIMVDGNAWDITIDEFITYVNRI